MTVSKFAEHFATQSSKSVEPTGQKSVEIKKSRRRERAREKWLEIAVKIL